MELFDFMFSVGIRCVKIDAVSRGVIDVVKGNFRISGLTEQGSKQTGKNGGILFQNQP
jgi:hypothetical protein